MAYAYVLLCIRVTIFSNGSIIPTSFKCTQLHTLTLAARSYALLKDSHIMEMFMHVQLKLHTSATVLKYATEKYSVSTWPHTDSMSFKDICIRTSAHVYTVHQYVCILYISTCVYCTSVHVYTVHQYVCILYISTYVYCTSAHVYTVHQYVCILYISTYVYCTSAHVYTVHQHVCILYISTYVYCTSAHVYTVHQHMCILHISTCVYCTHIHKHKM